MILLIDNYDSFSYNLYQLIGSIRRDILVVRNDELTVEEIKRLSPDAIVLSPGPGKPEDAGVCVEVVQKLGATVPILGVCLGHQAICVAYGGIVSYAGKIMHGKQSIVSAVKDEVFDGLTSFPVARYHSLSAKVVPDCLRVLARSEDGEVMTLRHKRYPVYGFQFHPESILTPDGARIVSAFFKGVSK
ncbi:MAG: aminodeoxychorismate/anthranilate synthase component II [Clostridia bacterium]|nr:aminodeoxychorismate/anthranilate synthase component II [Clostridia bacterium]